MEDQTHIGTVTGVSPGKRRLRVEMAKSYVSYALSLPDLQFQNKVGTILKCKVDLSTRAQDGISVTLVAGVPRDTIAQLKKNKIVVRTDEIERDSVRYDVSELVGLSVCDADGSVVGIVASSVDTRASGMILVSTSNGNSIMLPVTSTVVSGVNWSTESVVLQPGIPVGDTMDNDDTLLT